MRLLGKVFVYLTVLIGLARAEASAQRTSTGNTQGDGNTGVAYDNQGRPIKKTNKQDSLQHRDKFVDSITIYYRYFDSTRTRTLDSSLNDFNKRFPVPYTYEDLGNLGTAARPLLFSPGLKAGWDAGFHQYDLYKFTIENTKFYQTTRPFTELGYLLGSKSEQLINFTHTQNRKNNFNFSLEYRFSNSPGLYRTQNASHNNVRFATHYQSPNKRYESFFIYLSNKHASSENGGLVDKGKLDSLALGNPYEIDTRLGSPILFNTNPFNTKVNTGNIYKETNIMYRHQYDLGTKDSLVTDSVTYHLFYPRFRMQHTLLFTSNEYMFMDNAAVDSVYKQYFNYAIANPSANGVDTIMFKDKWTKLSNEFSLISFPDKNNQSQYAKVGAIIQNLFYKGNDTISHTYYNVSLVGEYRNRTRNNIWDIIANGQLYLNGLNGGDYQAYISLKRQLSKTIGSLQLGFQNVNKTPSFIYSNSTSLPVQLHQTFKKENTIHLFAVYENPLAKVKLGGDYYLVNNYAYSDSFFTVKQDATLFNVLHVYGEKRFDLSKHWHYYAELHLQQATGGAPLNMPQLITRHRIAYEGNFYTNLFLSTGFEIRYLSNYKAPNYSPFTGQFFYQDNYTLSNRPDVNFFFHFRIRSFKAFVRLENLNTLSPSKGFSFNHYNFKLVDYPATGLWTHVGIWWNFVN
ncbi:putative porin [Parasediminibacterium sp. JCM 36343]|uniref:putative porin n=1 Tax=Parasediminibacterium sp. JCM 36343 TaxID=3374279 RepID=UPI00397DFF44